MTFPVERLWLYFKIARNLDKFDDDDFTNQVADLELCGVEDKFAKCEQRFFFFIRRFTLVS